MNESEKSRNCCNKIGFMNPFLGSCDEDYSDKKVLEKDDVVKDICVDVFVKNGYYNKAITNNPFLEPKEETEEDSSDGTLITSEVFEEAIVESEEGNSTDSDKSSYPSPVQVLEEEEEEETTNKNVQKEQPIIESPNDHSKRVHFDDDDDEDDVREKSSKKDANFYDGGPTLGYSGSISHRSDASTASCRSFAFPILKSEWDHSSPVRMAKADKGRLRKCKGWKSALLCCRF